MSQPSPIAVTLLAYDRLNGTNKDMTMRQPPYGILIGGTSHVGKTTLATRLAQGLGCELVSTDSLARHPGRPWPSVRPQVGEFYANLSDDTVHWFLKVHHENMWPRIQRIISDFQTRSAPFVLEGSALRPDYMAKLDQPFLKPVFLYADDDFLRSRMTKEAGYDNADRQMVAIIDKFIERSIRENREMLAAARSAGIACIDVGLPGSLETLSAELLNECSVVENQ